MKMSDMAVVVTGCRRPYYLERTLASWSAAGGVHSLGRFVVALGHSARERQQLEMLDQMKRSRLSLLEIHEDSPLAAVSPGMHRALGEAGQFIFSDPAVQFAVFGEEDIVVSDDVLLYMLWGAREFHRPGIMAVSAHNPGGMGWDPHVPPADADADQEAVRILPYWHPWVWGVWRDVWEQVLEPSWDFNCDSGGGSDSGYDWNIATRVLPRNNLTCLIPDASRSQNIGEHEGTYSTPWSWSFSQSQSFRERRGDSKWPEYRLVTGEDQEGH